MRGDRVSPETLKVTLKKSINIQGFAHLTAQLLDIVVNQREASLSRTLTSVLHDVCADTGPA